MTNSVKSALSSASKQPSTGHGGAASVSFDQLSAAPSSAATSFKRPGSSGKRSAKSYGKLEKSFSLAPRFTIAESLAAADGAPTRSHDPIARSESIAVHHRLPIGEHLVTEIRRPSMWPEEFMDKEPEYDPDEEARRWRRQIEAALRMYPRNTWGPTTKWGFWEEVPGNGSFKQRCHFKDRETSHHVNVKM